MTGSGAEGMGTAGLMGSEWAGAWGKAKVETARKIAAVKRRLLALRLEAEPRD